MFSFLTRRTWHIITLAALTFSLNVHAQSNKPAPPGKWADKANFAALDEPNPTQQFIVTFKRRQDAALKRDTIEQRLQQAARSTGRALRYQRVLATGGHLVTVDGALDRRASEAFMLAVAQDTDVAYIEPDVLLQPDLIPNDTRFNEQWHYTEAFAGLNLEDAWDAANGAGVRVAVIDTGITAHPDLNANIVGGYDFISSATRARDGNGRDANPADEGNWFTFGACGEPRAADSDWHGTHVAGTVAARTNNNFGVAGVAFGARVVPIRALGRCGGSLSDIAEAVIWASGGNVSGVPANANPARIINMSLGGAGACGSTYQNAINFAAIRGTLVVVSAGNSDAEAAGFRPGNCMNVLNVAALDRQGNRAFYSNFGAGVDVSAPGGEVFIGDVVDGVLSTVNTGITTPVGAGYAFYQGTSMAAPHVAGLAALLLDVDPTLHSSDLNSVIMNRTRPIPGTCVGGCGRGLVDATATVDAVQPTTSPPGTPAGFRITIYGGGLNALSWLPMADTDRYQIYRSSSANGSYSFHRQITRPGIVEYVSSNTYFKVRGCNAFGCSGFTPARLAIYRSCGGPGERPCE